MSGANIHRLSANLQELAARRLRSRRPQRAIDAIEAADADASGLPGPWNESVRSFYDFLAHPGVEAQALPNPLRDFAMPQEDGDAHLHNFGEARLNGLVQLVGRHIGEETGEGTDKNLPQLCRTAEISDRQILA